MHAFVRCVTVLWLATNCALGGHQRLLTDLHGGIATLGEYYIHVSIGTPAQRFRVQVDTGSSSLIVPGVGCTTCVHSPKASFLVQTTTSAQHAMESTRHSTDTTQHSTDTTRHSTDTTQRSTDTTRHSTDTTQHSTDINHPTTINIVKRHVAKSYDVGKSSTGHPVGCASDTCGSDTCTMLSCGFRTDNCFAVPNEACCANDDTKSCGFYLRYGGDVQYAVSASGRLVNDVFSVSHNPHHEVSATLYQTLEETGEWPSQVDGILGLAFPTLNCNPTCVKPAYEVLLESLSKTRQLGAENGVFAMCMGDLDGKMVFGDDGRLDWLVAGGIEGAISYVPVTGYLSTYYTVSLDGVYVNSFNTLQPQKSGSVLDQLGVGTSNMEAIVDSGTTLILLQGSVWDSLVHHMQTEYCSLPGVCAPNLQDTIFTQGVCLNQLPTGFPNITFQLGNDLKLNLSPRMYFIRYENPAFGIDSLFSPGPKFVYCLGIQRGDLERTILGNTLMRAYVTVFDRFQKRVGFAVPNSTVCKTDTMELAPVSSGPVHSLFGIPMSATSWTYFIGVFSGVGVMLLLWLLVVVCWHLGQSSRHRSYFESLGMKKLSLGRPATFGTFDRAEGVRL